MRGQVPTYGRGKDPTRSFERGEVLFGDWYLPTGEGRILRDLSSEVRSYAGTGTWTVSQTWENPSAPAGGWPANLEHISQSRPDSGRGFQVKVLNTLQVVPSSEVVQHIRRMCTASMTVAHLDSLADVGEAFGTELGVGQRERGQRRCSP